MRARQRKGFTLIELLVVVAIIGILSSIGYTQASVLLPRYRAYQAARDFANQVVLLRQHAATDGIEHRIALISYDRSYLDPDATNGGTYYMQSGNRDAESTRWEFLPTDALADGADDEVGMGSADLAATHPKVSLVPWAALSGPAYGGSSNTDCIVFSPRGWLVNPNGDFNEAGQIVVEFINKSALLRESVEVYQVKISRTGMVRIDFNDALYEGVVENPQGIDQGSSSTSTSSSGGGGEHEEPS
jgi:prepilin-type N-terminal cleavage/methylation domain-containing protein